MRRLLVLAAVLAAVAAGLAIALVVRDGDKAAASPPEPLVSAIPTEADRGDAVKAATANVRADLVRPSATAATAAVPRGFVRHQCPHWTWFGPRDYIADCSTNGINVSSPTGTLAQSHGFSADFCSPTPRDHFQRKIGEFRAALRVRGAWLGNFSAIHRLGPKMFRQTMNFGGFYNDGTRFRGEVSFVYGLDNPPPYCFAMGTHRYAPVAGYARSIFILRKIYEHMYFCSPGLDDDDRKICD